MKDLQTILREIMREGKKSPGEWKSIAAPTRGNTGTDLLLFHPISGPIFQVRAYEKNPYQMQGIGTRISRSIDEDFLKLIDKRKQSGDLGILDLNFKLLQRSMKEGGNIDKILFNALTGQKNQGIDYLNLGNSFTRPQNPLPLLTDEQKRLDKEFKRLVKRDGKDSMFG
ncbi:hypothetical protein CEE45_12215 [Candidatus Heimdallarchaeota archaeon B3_Heim]|nr:MAG: hypothetical protein CEE45_12215 [Candidatus Heimdallarchaeota archaeon B3_Heim]